MDVSKLTDKECREYLETFYASDYISIYLAVKDQMEKLAKKVREAEIEFDGEDKAFDAFMKFGDKFEKISDSLEKIKLKIDDKELQKAKDEELKAKVGTPESYVKNKS